MGGVESFAQVFVPKPEGRILIHPNGDKTKCLGIKGGLFANGSPVQIQACDDSDWQSWVFTDAGGKGSTVQVANKRFCLDAGDVNGQPNGEEMKIWDCYSWIPQQQWGFTDNKLLKLFSVEYEPLGVCLTVPEGGVQNGEPIQSWECLSGINKSQIWTTSPHRFSLPGPPMTTTV
ncbi:carbohydrate-binding module family 13 protein [Coprinopsis sp. MPI-PUGE-AT-0042]|nr:carbohydrate-binding module family 13 protein [Coprinopsis sp. MPI-PUGE-AT-0042]